MDAGGGERERGGAADAARGARHQRDALGRLRNFVHRSSTLLEEERRRVPELAA